MRTGSPPTLRGYDDLLICLPSPCVIAGSRSVKNIGRAARPDGEHRSRIPRSYSRSGRFKIVLFFSKNCVYAFFLQLRSRDDPMSMSGTIICILKTTRYTVTRSSFALMSFVRPFSQITPLKSLIPLEFSTLYRII